MSKKEMNMAKNNVLVIGLYILFLSSTYCELQAAEQQVVEKKEGAGKRDSSEQKEALNKKLIQLVEKQFLVSEDDDLPDWEKIYQQVSDMFQKGANPHVCDGYGD